MRFKLLKYYLNLNPNKIRFSEKDFKNLEKFLNQIYCNRKLFYDDIGIRYARRQYLKEVKREIFYSIQFLY